MKRTLRRRRFEAKTDYKARLALIESGKMRLVIRKTNQYIIAQLVRTDVAQDFVVVSASSNELLTKGWSKEKRGSLKSRAAAYLTGLLLASKAKGKTEEAVLDLGMNRNIHKSRIYAALKGVIEGGISIPHNEIVLPSDEMIEEVSELRPLVHKIKQSLLKHG